MMSRSSSIVCPWVTPKIFLRLDDPRPRIVAFFDHYAEFFKPFDEVILNFCAGNGDHILSYAGKDRWDESFDWARYNCYNASPEARASHNLNWLRRTREGGEVSDNPTNAGPSFILSEEILTYRKLRGIYDAFREEAAARKVPFKLLEYLEPGPEFCDCQWKTVRHPEGAAGSASAGGTILQGVIDVCSALHADSFPYAAYPSGIPEGTNTGDFCVAQTDAFTRDMQLDGVFLGNQFGLLGLWHPDNAPPADPIRRAAIRHFFHQLRRKMGERLIYWMDTYWPAEVEIDKWQMCEENYAQLDAVMISNFAVLVERTQIVPNLESRLRIAETAGGKPLTLFSFDFVDPWYTYRVYLDHRKDFHFQHEVYKKHGHRCQGISFFANDTFGHFVMPTPLNETLQAIKSGLSFAAGMK
jgi:hypothetical protein